MTDAAPSTAQDDSKTPFQKVVDDLTGGCGCACHTGTGYRTACVHCRPSTAQDRVDPNELCDCELHILRRSVATLTRERDEAKALLEEQRNLIQAYDLTASTLRTERDAQARELERLEQHNLQVRGEGVDMEMRLAEVERRLGAQRCANCGGSGHERLPGSRGYRRCDSCNGKGF